MTKYVSKFAMPDGEVIEIKSSTMVEQLRGTNAVVIGDSWSDPNIPNSSYGRWPKRVFEDVFQMTLFNYAKAGWGFGVANKRFYDESVTAVNAMTAEQRENTSIVCIFGGLNDLIYHVSNSDIQEGYYRLIENVGQNYPNARIMVFPFQWGYGHITALDDPSPIYGRNYESLAKIGNNITDFRSLSSTRSVEIVDKVFTWNVGQYEEFRNDNHLNDTGYDRLAGYIVSAILGGNPTKSVGGSISVGSSELENCEMLYYVQDGIVYFTFQAKTLEELTDADITITTSVNPWLSASRHMTFPLISTHKYEPCGYLWFDITNKKIKVEVSQLDASYYMFANGSFPVASYEKRITG